MKNSLVVIAIVVAVLTSGGVGYLVGTGNTFTTTQTTTLMQSTNSSNTSEICTFVAEGFLSMKVLNSSNNEPISSLPVHVEAQYPACASNPAYNQDLGTINTNASGILSLSGPYNWYYFSIKYGPRSYAVNATINAGLLTCITFTIPAGDLNITQSCDPASYFAP